MSFGKNSEMADIKTDNNCWNCEYFGITHDKHFPYKCLAMNFKSKLLPCLEVVKIEGDQCLSFSIKSIKR
tara:strand:+ start:637 stop:846 length:210 start_codon:yes stop_codon:yes gene_type:complete